MCEYNTEKIHVLHRPESCVNYNINLCKREKGNSIYPTNDHEVQIRRDFFLRSYAECQNLISQIEVAYELIHFETKVLEEWSELIATQINLLKGTIAKDRKRFKKK